MRKIVFSFLTSSIIIIFNTSCNVLQEITNATETVKEVTQVVKETNTLVKTTTKTVKSFSDLKKELNQTTKEFNNNGRVVKGNNKSVKNDNTLFAEIKGGKFKNMTWMPIIYEKNHVFPSAIVTLSTYNEHFTNELEVLSRPIGFVINSNVTNRIVRWEIESSDKRFFNKITGEFVVEESNKMIHIMPEIPWNYQQLTNNLTNTPSSITYRFFDSEGNKIEETRKITYRSINDCILRYKDTQTHYMIAGYIQESHPEIDIILKEALETGFTNSFSGYQVHNINSLIEQITAIWRALQLRKFRYSSVATSSANDSDKISTQSVRTFDNSINNNQANCVDGTIMLASILRKIGINTQIITVEKHCYLAVYTDKKEDFRLFVETTEMGWFPELGSKTAPDIQSYKNVFIKMLNDAAKEHDDYVKEGKLYAEINVEKARNSIDPIPVY